jgi:predicted RNA-binding Zn ribbon-like protein
MNKVMEMDRKRMPGGRRDAPRYGEFTWIGGDPSVDFVNTVTWRTVGLRRERIGSIQDVIAWAAEAFGPDAARRLPAYAARHPRKADRVLDRGFELRRNLHDLFGAVAAGGRAPAAELRSFNAALQTTFARTSVQEAEPLEWHWSSPDNPLEVVLCRVIWSAAGLLTSPDVGLLRQCANPECGWVFVDRSRKRNRRWCGLECSSQDKSSRYYARQRKGRDKTSPFDA